MKRTPDNFLLNMKNERIDWKIVNIANAELEDIVVNFDWTSMPAYW